MEKCIPQLSNAFRELVIYTSPIESPQNQCGHLIGCQNLILTCLGCSKEKKHLVPVGFDKCDRTYTGSTSTGLVTSSRSKDQSPTVFLERWDFVLFSYRIDRLADTFKYSFALKTSREPFSNPSDCPPSLQIPCDLHPKAITDMLNRIGVDLCGVTRVNAYSPHSPQPAVQSVSKPASGVERI